MLFTVTSVNDIPLNNDFALNTDEDVTLVFTAANFTDNYLDVDGDSLVHIQITSLPEASKGTLYLGT